MWIVEDAKRILALLAPQIAGQIDRAMASLATRQHGVVARWQLLELGMTPHMVKGGIQRGVLHVMHRGV